MFQVDFDPEVVSYEELLEVFWTSHNPCSRPWSRQYMSAVFTHDDQQLEIAERTGAAAATERGGELRTLIEPLDRFYLAEDYHQKYRLRRFGRATEELEAIYPELDDFVRSTVATKLNAYVGGSLPRERFEAIAGELGLSKDALAEVAR